MNHWNAIQTAISQLEDCHKTAWMWVNPSDFKRIHIDKVSIRFMKRIKRNRKLRNNGFKK